MEKFEIAVIISLLAFIFILICSATYTRNIAYSNGFREGSDQNTQAIIDLAYSNGHIILEDPETNRTIDLIEYDYSLELCALSVKEWLNEGN